MLLDRFENLFLTIGNTTSVIRALSEEMMPVCTNQITKIIDSSKQIPIVLASLGILVHITCSLVLLFSWSSMVLR